MRTPGSRALVHYAIVEEQPGLPRPHPAARHPAHHDRPRYLLVQVPQQMVGWERERVADQQVGTGLRPVEPVPGEHAPFRGAHELYVERLGRLG
jgi:hypothetical protein